MATDFEIDLLVVEKAWKAFDPEAWELNIRKESMAAWADSYRSKVFEELPGNAPAFRRIAQASARSLRVAFGNVAYDVFKGGTVYHLAASLGPFVGKYYSRERFEQPLEIAIGLIEKVADSNPIAAAHLAVSCAERLEHSFAAVGCLSYRNGPLNECRFAEMSIALSDRLISDNPLGFAETHWAYRLTENSKKMYSGFSSYIPEEVNDASARAYRACIARRDHMNNVASLAFMERYGLEKRPESPSVDQN